MRKAQLEAVWERHAVKVDGAYSGGGLFSELKPLLASVQGNPTRYYIISKTKQQ